jgi:hypothetical protein
MFLEDSRSPRRGLGTPRIGQSLHDTRGRERRLTTSDQPGLLCGETNGLSDNPVSLIIGAEQRRQDGCVADADCMG